MHTLKIETSAYIHTYIHIIYTLRFSYPRQPFEMHITVFPGESLVEKGEGEAAIYVPHGVYAPQLQQLEVQGNGRVRAVQVRLRMQTKKFRRRNQRSFQCSTYIHTYIHTYITLHWCECIYFTHTFISPIR